MEFRPSGQWEAKQRWSVAQQIPREPEMPIERRYSMPTRGGMKRITLYSKMARFELVVEESEQRKSTRRVQH